MRKSVRLGLLLVVMLVMFLLFAGGLTVLADGRRHVVRPGETLYSIGRLYGVNPYEIARINGLADPNRIYVGQVLRIPGGAGPPPPPPPRTPPPTSAPLPTWRVCQLLRENPSLVSRYWTEYVTVCNPPGPRWDDRHHGWYWPR